ncbi:MAG: signal peptidase II [Rickettsiales bacterium]|nr:signal peptidase II [Rickettsiales bacterium]
MKNILKNKLFLKSLLIAFIVAVLDLLSKRVIFAILENIAMRDRVDYPQIEVLPFFNIVYVWNRGVSFGMFNNIENAHLLLSILQFLVALVIAIWMYNNKNKFFTVPLGLIVGGALGNVIDRIKNGAVADFLDFHIANYHWPAFNVADSCVFMGVAIIIFYDLYLKKKREAK